MKSLRKRPGLRIADIPVWAATNTRGTNKNAERRAKIAVQCKEFIDTMERATWMVETQLWQFVSGELFIKVVPVTGIPLQVTPQHLLRGTRWETMPAHITMGHPPPGVDIEEVGKAVTGKHVLRLKKCLPRPESSTYEPVGMVGDMCKRCVSLGFAPSQRPDYKWHISL